MDSSFCVQEVQHFKHNSSSLSGQMGGQQIIKQMTFLIVSFFQSRAMDGVREVMLQHLFFSSLICFFFVHKGMPTPDFRGAAITSNLSQGSPSGKSACVFRKRNGFARRGPRIKVNFPNMLIGASLVVDA